MKLLLVNPNTTQALTDRMARVAAGALAAGTDLVPLTAPRGVPYIASRAEAQIGGAVALEMLAEARHGADAAIIAAFGDPGLAAAREMLTIPVVGLAEAAMLTACMLGRRFAIVSFATSLEAWYRDTVEQAGLYHRCAGVLCSPPGFTRIDAVQDEMGETLVSLAHDCVERLQPDVIILGGAPLAGLAATVRDRIPVPLVDPVVAAVKQAEALVALAPAKARAGSYRLPPGKPSSGLNDRLAAWLADPAG